MEEKPNRQGFGQISKSGGTKIRVAVIVQYAELNITEINNKSERITYHGN